MTASPSSSAPAAVLCALATHLPETVLTNADLVRRLPVDEKWIVQRTGVHRRHVLAPSESTSDMAVAAGAAALQRAPGPVQLLIVATMTPDRPIPGTAPLVASRMGLDHVAAFDLNAACSGFVYGLATACGLLCSGMYERILLIAADAMTLWCDPADPMTTPIFGDGAAAVLRAGHAAELGALGPFDLGSDGTGETMVVVEAEGTRRRTAPKDTPPADPYLTLRGREVYRHAVQRMEASCRTTLELADWGLQSVDRLAAHQANKRITASVAGLLGVPSDRCLSNIADVGNTAAASIPLLLAHSAARGQLTAGDRVLMTAFGGGFTWASTTLTRPSLPTEET